MAPATPRAGHDQNEEHGEGQRDPALNHEDAEQRRRQGRHRADRDVERSHDDHDGLHNRKKAGDCNGGSNDPHVVESEEKGILGSDDDHEHCDSDEQGNILHADRIQHSAERRWSSDEDGWRAEFGCGHWSVPFR